MTAAIQQFIRDEVLLPRLRETGVLVVLTQSAATENPALAWLPRRGRWSTPPKEEL